MDVTRRARARSIFPPGRPAPPAWLRSRLIVERRICPILSRFAEGIGRALNARGAARARFAGGLGIQRVVRYRLRERAVRPDRVPGPSQPSAAARPPGS